MNIEEKLELLRDYYCANRKVGFTTLLKEGTNNYSKSKFIVAYKKDDWKYLNCSLNEIVSWNSLDVLKRHNKPLAIDNDVMYMLLNESLQRIEELKLKIK
ncbi:MAG: hypothetical protein WC554_12210 [Clostridia bacterium]